VNAIENATGISVREIPATPEVMMEAMTEKAAEIV
jgi:CO/xanthine dehydrogenase Mo-binding subunit